MKQLILGGARSGKSSFAEQLAEATGRSVTYVATAEVGDEEMHDRIERHKQERPEAWKTIEEPVNLARAIRDESRKDRVLLVDCLTLWLSNCLMQETGFSEARTALLESVKTASGPVIMVSNEVGQGIVPMGALSRRFVDEAGWLHQDLAQICDRVFFVTAGLPQVLKGQAL